MKKLLSLAIVGILSVMPSFVDAMKQCNVDTELDSCIDSTTLSLGKYGFTKLVQDLYGQKTIRLIGDHFLKRAQRENKEIGSSHTLGGIEALLEVINTVEHDFLNNPKVSNALTDDAKKYLLSDLKQAHAILDSFPTAIIANTKLIQVQGQPTFFQAWSKASSPAEKGNTLTLLVANIRSIIRDLPEDQANHKTVEYIHGLKRFLTQHGAEVSSFVRTRIDEIIRELINGLPESYKVMI